MRTDEHFHGIGGHALLDDFASCFVPQSSADALDRCERALSEWLLDRLLARGADGSESHAVGEKKRGERMNQYLGHAERIGDETGVLPAGTAEAVEGVARDVVAALHRDLLDRVRHVLDGNLDEAVGNIFGGAAIAARPGV